MSKPLQHDANLSMSYNELSVNSMENFNDKNISLALINFEKSQTTFLYDKKFCDFDNKETEKGKLCWLLLIFFAIRVSDNIFCSQWHLLHKKVVDIFA